jgi:hypothetical protein
MLLRLKRIKRNTLAKRNIRTKMTMQFNIPKDVIFTVHEPEIFNENRQSSEWYCFNIPDLLASLEYNGEVVEIRSCGEMKLRGPNGAVIRYSEAFSDYDMRIDDDIIAAIDSGEWTYDMNNWFEVWIGEYGYEDGIIADDVTNAIEIAIKYLKEGSD